MDLDKKIKEIRNKPEHIRVRYVWGAVGICMFFVLALWIFSVKDTMKTMGRRVKSSGSCMTDFKKRFDESSKTKAPSIKEMLNQTSQRLETGMSGGSPALPADRQPTTNNQQPATDNLQPNN